MPRAAYDCLAITPFLFGLLCLSFPSLLFSADKDLPLIPENISLLGGSLAWDESFELRTGVGYKDNVLLSHAGAQGSPFVASGLDFSVIRLPVDNWQFYFFLTADDNRYWHEAGADKEETVLASSEARKDLAGQWKLGSGLNFTYQNEILDVTSIETFTNGASSARVQGPGVTLRPFVRHDFPSRWWVQFELPATRQFLKAPLDDYWQFGGKIILGREYGSRSELTASYGLSELWYDTRNQFAASGYEIPNTPLKLLQHRLELGSQHYWDTARHWRSSTKLGFAYDQDNGSGYFSYYKYELSEQLRYQTPAWEIRGRAGIIYYDFPVQTVSILDPSKLNKTLVSLDLRIERRLAGFVKVFGEYELEHSFSNDPFTRYNVNTVTGGFQWEF